MSIEFNKKLSIITTLYKSCAYIDEFHTRVTVTAKKIANEDYEIIYVNDGCPEASELKVKEIVRNDKNTYLVDLSRNFGHHNAIMAGLSYAKGNLIFLLDVDLEEHPELLNVFYKEMQNNKCDVVFGVQKNRRGGIFEKISGFIFYKSFNLLTNLSVAENLITARLMTRRYVKALLLFEEREVTIAGLWQITGFKQVSVFVEKTRNRKSTYNLVARISLLINAITSFSNKPLVYIFYIGILIFTISLILNLILIIQWFFLNKPLMGWTSLIASIWLIGGMIISFLGVIGIYLAKIYTEAKMRPRVIVKEVLQYKEIEKINK
jgi:putative glycosyltransferase